MASPKGTGITRRDFVKGAGALALATTALDSSMFTGNAAPFTARAQSRSIGQGINILLIHGAFVDASSWNRVIGILQPQGFHILAAQNPNTSFENDVQATRAALQSLKGPTVVVGHSYAGAVISNVPTDATHVKGLVYIAAYATGEGESQNTISAKFAPPPLSKHIVSSYFKGYIQIDPPAFWDVFIQDAPKAEAQIFAAAQKPIEPSCFAGVTKSPAWKKFPSWYLVSRNDHAINPDAERYMAKRIGAHTREINSSHASPITHPRDVVDIIIAAAQGKS
ncbi:alpha/beta fold hydrolase [Ktedonospora formicarum]|uniref:Alpha/beta hydrolase n=1 Tax=Ktedonospora formicarum TaxID=2778364 RepID=A0A8J3MYN2_9CHLR|nr:alpha/beta hydrolase [Ktedonospora formicarum]GHO50998.1 alpha/beta hydrolase [Ktedonospora formicarum]